MQPTKIEISNRLHIRLALSMLNGQPTELLRRMMRIVDPKAPATLKRIREVANILGMNTLDVVKPLTSDEVEWAAIAIAAGGTDGTLRGSSVKSKVSPTPVRRSRRGLGNAKLNHTKVAEIKQALIDESETKSELARRYNVSPPAIHLIANGTTWKDVPWPSAPSPVDRI